VHDHAPKDTCAQHSKDKQSWSSMDCLWNQDMQENELVCSYQMDSTQPTS